MSGWGEWTACVLRKAVGKVGVLPLKEGGKC